MPCPAQIIIGDSRQMPEVPGGGVHLVVTSPPYWHLKDYGGPRQTGYGQSLHAYLQDLYHTWQECFRLLAPGGRLCLNIGDQFARAAVYGRYKVIPLHAELVAQCEAIGFDFLGAIIWQKKTTLNTTGGANVMGSYPYPPNGLVELDYEFIQIFKKPGPPRKVAPEVKAAARLTKAEWKEFFSGHWQFAGARKLGHEARFPEELPRRLIKMFTFPGDTVLDPYLGSGTTLKVALELGRRGLGYEINEAFLGLIRENLGWQPGATENLQIIRRPAKDLALPALDYRPRIQDASPVLDPKEFRARQQKLFKVVEIVNPLALRVDSGQTVRFLGITVLQPEAMVQYLNKHLLGRAVILKFDGPPPLDRQVIDAYVYLKNKIFINAYLIKSGLAAADPAVRHRLQNKFVRLTL